MMLPKILVNMAYCCVLSLVLATSLVTDAAAQSTPALGERYALVVGGIGGQEAFTQKHYAQTRRMYDILVDSLGYVRKNVYYLFENPSLDSLVIDGKATADQVREAFRELQQRMQREDQLFVFLVGHGTFDGDWAKFNLVGPDLRDIDYAQMVARLPSDHIIFVNTTSGSGPFLEHLSRKGRVVITATRSGLEVYATTFADYFMDALVSSEAALDKDGRVSMLEAFQYAKTKQDAAYADERQMRAEHPRLADNGTILGDDQEIPPPRTLTAARMFLDPPPRELRERLEKFRQGQASRLDSLEVRRQQLLSEIDQLRTREDEMEVSEYKNQLEGLFIELARVTREIKALQSEQGDVQP